MAEDFENRIRAKNNELVSRIYGGALNPSEYNDIFHAWDDLFQELVGQDERKQSEDFEWTNEFVSHFEQAGKLFDNSVFNRERPLKERILEMPFSVFLCRTDGTLVAKNRQAEASTSLTLGSNIREILFDPHSEKALGNLGRTGNATEGSSDGVRLVVRICSSENDEPDIYLAEVIEDGCDEKSDTEGVLLLRALTATWSDSVGLALAAAFQLTQAELDLVKLLYQGLTIKEIAEWKERSKATIRTQLSSVLQKTGSRSQADLSRVVSGLVQVFQQAEPDPAKGQYAPRLNTQTRQRSSTLDLGDGVQIEIVESGDLDGKPFYFIQTSSSPILPPEVVNCLADRGVRLVSPHRSGLGSTTRKPTTFTPADWAKLHLAALRKLEISPTCLGGHRCGGIYALELAKLLGAECRNLLLVDTGAPLRNALMINQMPSAPKRLFLAARYFPPAIRTPYKLITSDFYHGKGGEGRMVDYYFDGSPEDQKILMTKDYWQITRDNIDYCLRNPLQAAQDVTIWSGDTSGLLETVLKNTHVHYFHGRCNYVHQASNIEKMKATTDKISAHVVDGRGQLLIYAEPDLFAREIQSLFMT